MSKRLISFDWAIKRLLRNKANFVVLEGFLSELLFDNIKIEQILESEGNQESEDDKFNIHQMGETRKPFNPLFLKGYKVFLINSCDYWGLFEI